jgi:benzoate-CoA ligase
MPAPFGRDGRSGGRASRGDEVVAAGSPGRFNAAEYFVDRNVASGRGARVAIECGDDRISYGELHERVNRIGSALRHRFGVRIEERVVLILPDGPEFIYSFFGAMKIGAVPVPVNTLLKPADYEYFLNDSRARVAIVGAALMPALGAIPAHRLLYLEQLIVVGRTPDGRGESFAAVIDAGQPTLDAAATTSDDAAFWLYSSGSTGAPKACVHRHHDMPYCAQAYAQSVLGITDRDRCFSVARLFFAYGLGNAMYFPFSVGATAILSPGAPAAAHVYDVIERYRPTLFFSVPTNYAMLLAHRRPEGDFDLSSIRFAVSAGEALPPALYERFRARFGVEVLDGIGSTEILHIFISNRPGHVKAGASGTVVPGYEARIVDEAERAVARGEIGNLLVKGDSVCAHYWNNHDKTRTTIAGEWIRTGDKYWQDEDGDFHYAGRSDDMLKVGGLWVSPTDVESALLEHPSVLECAVVGRRDGDGLTKPAAYVVLRDGSPRGHELAVELIEFVRGRLADYKRPRWVEFIDTLPKTATGKIQRFQLRAAADTVPA